MGKTRKDRRDYDYEFSRNKNRKEFARKRKRKDFGRNRSAEEIIEEYNIDDYEE